MNDEIGNDGRLDERLRAAMHKLASGYQPASERGDATEPIRGRSRRSPWWTSVAAATVLVVGAGIGVVLTRAQHNSESDVAAEPSSVPTSPPAWTDRLTIPDIDEPTVAVRIDEELLDEPLMLQNPYVRWGDSIPTLGSLWYVRFDGGVPVSSIAITDHPAWTWDIYEQIRSNAAPDGSEVAAADGEGFDTWQNPDGTVRVVHTVGEVSAQLDEILADPRATIDDLRAAGPPDGYVALVEPVIVSSMAQTTSSELGWLAVLYEPAADQLDRYLATWPLSGDVTEIPGGWLSGSAEDGWRAAVAIDGYTVRIFTPDDVPASTMQTIRDHVELVPVSEVPWASPFEHSAVDPAPTPVLAGGELSIGRWVAFDTTDLDGRPGDVLCQRFVGALRGLDGCVDDDATAWTRCGWVAGPYDEDTGRYVLLTTETFAEHDDLAARVDGDDADVTIEQSGGFTVVYATVVADPLDHPDVTIVDSTGNELCP